MMETKISEEEFMRLQNQLIDLRIANYALKEQNAVHKVKNRETCMKLEVLEKEYNKLNSSLSIYKEQKNLDVINQNKVLQLKLQAQEDDFRLQNETLLKELALLDAENKKLQTKVNANEIEFGESVEVKKLKEEVEALKRILSEERLRSIKEFSKLKADLRLLVEGPDEEDEDLCHGSEEGFLMNADSHGSEPSNFLEKLSGNERTGLICTEGISESKSPQSTLDETKEELDIFKSKCEVEIEILSDLIKNRKDKYESLKSKLNALDVHFVKFRAASEQIIHGLEKQLHDAQEEVILLKGEKANITMEIENLKKDQHEKFLEREIVNTKEIEYENKLVKVINVAENLKNENSSLVESVEKLTTELLKKNELLEEMTTKSNLLQGKCDEMKDTIGKYQQAFKKESKEMNDKMLELQERYNSLEESKDRELKELRQKASDFLADQVLNEKKNSVICRDLKRQLALERCRSEKLQEKLRDYETLTSKQELSKIGNIEVTPTSSSNVAVGNLEALELPAQGNHTTGSPVKEIDLVQENKNLLARLTALQEEKWLLEEQVNHLEQGSAAMAEDIMKKSELIKYYCMDTRIEYQPSNSRRRGVKRLSDLIKGSEGENIQESHAPMQRMLEETLTKNMYLQRDVEHLSKELANVRVSCSESSGE